MSIDTYTYNLDVVSTTPIPPDVLVEHIAVALRDFKLAGKIGINMNSTTVQGSGEATWDHPFDGPEVFDDDPKPKFAEGGYTGTHGEGSFTAYIGPDEPIFSKADIAALRLDPYPLTTEAAMQLKEARDERERNQS